MKAKCECGESLVVIEHVGEVSNKGYSECVIVKPCERCVGIVSMYIAGDMHIGDVCDDKLNQEEVKKEMGKAGTEGEGRTNDPYWKEWNRFNGSVTDTGEIVGVRND